MTDPDDPYGNLGAVPIASWDSRWMSWTKLDQDAYLASVAHWGPLAITQMVRLIQGLLPPTYEWISAATCLEEFSPLVKRLEQDIERGVTASAPTPVEFAAWCDLRNVSLPVPFVSEIRRVAAVPPVTHVPQQSPAKILGPAWLPVLSGKSRPARSRKPPKRGRPATTAATLNSMLPEATEILLAAAERGEILSLAVVARQLMSVHNELGMSEENLVRRLKGKLPIKQAKATATKHQVAAPSQMRRPNFY